MFPPVWIPSLYVSQFYKLNSDGKKKKRERAHSREKMRKEVCMQIASPVRHVLFVMFLSTNVNIFTLRVFQTFERLEL